MRKHFTLQVEKENVKKIKIDILSLSILIFLLALTGSALVFYNSFVPGLIVLIGVLAYILALSFSIGKIFESRTKNSGETVKKLLGIIFLLVMGFILFTIIQSVIVLKGFIDASTLEQKFYGFAALALLIFSILFWNILKNFVESNSKKGRLLFLIIPLLIVLLMGQSRITGAATLNETVGAVNTISDVMDTVDNVTSFISNQQSAITEMLGLDDTQSTILMGVVFLIALMLAARFIESIIKWLILILIGVFLIMLI